MGAKLADFFARNPITPFFMAEHAGPRLGAGAGRAVFALNGHNKHVLKVERFPGHFHNVQEWLTWEYSEYMQAARPWLAPCVAISPCGVMMVQRRTTPIDTALIPPQVPAWATDLKRQNWGLLEGRPVLHDYATSLVWNALASTATKPFGPTSGDGSPPLKLRK